MNIEVVLFKSLGAIQSLELPVGVSTSGKKFEDYMVMQLCQKLQQQVEYRVFPPRHTLRQATFSGLHHQFDIIISELNELVAIECKFRSSAHIDQLFATQGKLVDYHMPPRGIFVTTSQVVNDRMYHYALAHQISIVAPALPPIEYLLWSVKDGTDLAYRLGTIKDRIRKKAPPKHLLIEWKNNYSRFQDEGYC